MKRVQYHRYGGLSAELRLEEVERPTTGTRPGSRADPGGSG